MAKTTRVSRTAGLEGYTPNRRPQATPDPAPKAIDGPDERLSRDQETRANGKTHLTWDDLNEGDFTLRTREDMLQAPPKRPGYQQRWISVDVNGQANVDNIALRYGEGWLPRPLSSVSVNFPVPTISDGKYAGFIGVRGMVLMERPESIHKQARNQVRERTRRQMDAVEKDLNRVHEPGSKLGRPEMESRSTVEKGRRPTVAEDED